MNFQRMRPLRSSLSTDNKESAGSLKDFINNEEEEAPHRPRRRPQQSIQPLVQDDEDEFGRLVRSLSRHNEDESRQSAPQSGSKRKRSDDSKCPDDLNMNHRVCRFKAEILEKEAIEPFGSPLTKVQENEMANAQPKTPLQTLFLSSRL